MNENLEVSITQIPGYQVHDNSSSSLKPVSSPDLFVLIIIFTVAIDLIFLGIFMWAYFKKKKPK